MGRYKLKQESEHFRQETYVCTRVRKAQAWQTLTPYIHISLFASDRPTLKWVDISKTRRGSIPDGSLLSVNEQGNTDRNAVLRSIYTFRLFKTFTMWIKLSTMFTTYCGYVYYFYKYSFTCIIINAVKTNVHFFIHLCTNSPQTCPR